MANHNVVIHENTGATKESAPYLGTYISKDTVRESTFAPVAALKAGMSPIQFRAIIDGSFQAIEELEQSGLVRVHTDLGVICAEISNSFPTADAAPDPEVNKLNLVLRLADDIRLSLVDRIPAILADENLTKVRVDNVMDIGTGKPYNLIHGRHRFRIAGYNMDLGDEGATVYLTDKRGVTYEVTVDEVESKQLIIAHTTDLLEAGDYRLVVKSRAGDAEGPLQTAIRKVKYLRVEDPPTPPTLTRVHPSDEPENDGWMKPNPYENTVEGTNLAAATKLEFKYVDGEDEYVDEFEIVSKTADKIVFKANPDTLQDIGGHLIVTTPAGTCEGDFMATVMGS